MEAKKFNIENSQVNIYKNSFLTLFLKDGIRKMLMLIWSKDTNIKETVIEAYKQLYFNPSSETKEEPFLIAKNLIKYIFKNLNIYI